MRLLNELNMAIMTKRFTFHKPEHLCLKTEIDALFTAGSRSMSVYPLRVTYRMLPYAGSGLDLDKRPELKRTLAALRHQLDSTVEWKDFTTYFEQTNGQFLQQLKHLHPTLTANELRYLSLVYINLSSKEIALLLNITPEYCKKKKQQVARKMGLTDPRTLYAYLTGSEVMG
jgi:DNA-binding CsgD family transcriptional regulator